MDVAVLRILILLLAVSFVHSNVADFEPRSDTACSQSCGNKCFGREPCLGVCNKLCKIIQVGVHICFQSLTSIPCVSVKAYVCIHAWTFARVWVLVCIYMCKNKIKISHITLLLSKPCAKSQLTLVYTWHFRNVFYLYIFVKIIFDKCTFINNRFTFLAEINYSQLPPSVCNSPRTSP